MKAKCKIYIALFLCICALPSAGLLFGGMEESMENRDTAQAPVLFTETGVNVAFLRDAGAWFEDHFAFRNEWVTGHALLMGKLFHVSSQESVITGKDGWLFYRDSLEDFQGGTSVRPQTVPCGAFHGNDTAVRAGKRDKICLYNSAE